MLKKINRNYGICQVSPGYLLGQKIIKEWTALEQNLLFFTEMLFKKTNYLLPLEATLFPLPSNYGFHCTHKSPGGAHRVANASLKGFGPLMGWTSYLLT